MVERVEYTDIISFSICEPGGDTFNRRGKLGKLNFFLLSGVLSAKKKCKFFNIVIIKLSLDSLDSFLIIYI